MATLQRQISTDTTMDRENEETPRDAGYLTIVPSRKTYGKYGYLDTKKYKPSKQYQRLRLYTIPEIDENLLERQELGSENPYDKNPRSLPKPVLRRQVKRTVQDQPHTPDWHHFPQYTMPAAGIREGYPIKLDGAHAPPVDSARQPQVVMNMAQYPTPFAMPFPLHQAQYFHHPMNRTPAIPPDHFLPCEPFMKAPPKDQMLSNNVEIPPPPKCATMRSNTPVASFPHPHQAPYAPYYAYHQYHPYFMAPQHHPQDASNHGGGTHDRRPAPMPHSYPTANGHPGPNPAAIRGTQQRHHHQVTF